MIINNNLECRYCSKPVLREVSSYVLLHYEHNGANFDEYYHICEKCTKKVKKALDELIGYENKKPYPPKEG